MTRLNRRLWLALHTRMGRDTENFAPHGVAVKLPAGVDDTLRYFLARGRPYEADEADLVRELLAPGTHVAELGGCLGVISALIRRQIGPDAHHVVVEANPRLHATCATNAARGAAEGACTCLLAAIDYSGAATVGFDVTGNAHEGHVVGIGTGRAEVPATTLAEVLAQLPANGRRALVCDIEGAEEAMVRHDAACLTAFDTIILETHPDAYSGGLAARDMLIEAVRVQGFMLHRQARNVVAFRRKAI